MTNFQDKVGFIWSVADLLRGDYKRSEYGKVILPLTVLRRLDSVLEKTKAKVLAKAQTLPAKADEKIKDVMLCQAAGNSFYNLSKFTFKTLLDDPNHLVANLNHYITGFSPNAREIFTEKFKFSEQIARLHEGNILFLVLNKFTEINRHPDVVDNVTMGYIFEELIRKFSELSNETAGEHFTPREVIRLMVNLLFLEDDDDRIVADVLTNWHESKRAIPEDRWRKALAWMKEKKLVPRGFGKPTQAGRSGGAS
jgi:type I restriction enzyme M protein